MKRHSKHILSNPTLQALTEIGIFSHCPMDQLEPMLANTDVLRFPPGEVLARAGARAAQFLGLIDGYVEVTDRNGSSMVIGPGDQIGGRELLEDARFSATYTTLTPANLVVVFAPVFRWTARRSAEVATALADPPASSMTDSVSCVK
jgi:CRP-like cAMP-binding protein